MGREKEKGKKLGNGGKWHVVDRGHGGEHRKGKEERCGWLEGVKGSEVGIR